MSQKENTYLATLLWTNRFESAEPLVSASVLTGAEAASGGKSRKMRALTQEEIQAARFAEERVQQAIEVRFSI